MSVLRPFLGKEALETRLYGGESGASIRAYHFFPLLNDDQIYAVRTHLDAFYVDNDLRGGFDAYTDPSQPSRTAIVFSFGNTGTQTAAYVKSLLDVLSEIYGPETNVIDLAASRKAALPVPQKP